MVKGFKQIVSLTMLSRVLGLIRDVSCTYFFGATGLSDTWWLAFRIPNLTRRIFGEGAASASFIPVYSQELVRDKESAQRLAGTVVSVVFVILSGLVVLGWLFMGGYRLLIDTPARTELVFSLSSIMLPYAIMICMVAILAGVLNSHLHFAAPAAAPIVLNLCIIAAVLGSGLLAGMEARQQVFVVAVGVLVSGIIQLAMQFIPLAHLGLSIRPNWDVHSEAFKKIILMMGPMILGLTVTQINTLLDDVIAFIFSATQEKGDYFLFMGKQILYPVHEGAVTHLYLSQRLYQFPLGVFGISLATAIFPVLSKSAAEKDYDKLSETISKGIRFSCFIALPSLAGLLIVAKPLVVVLLEHGDKFDKADTDKVVFTLAFYAVGILGFFLQQIVTRAFYSMQDSRMPSISAVIAVCVNLVLNLTLIWFLGTGGLALSTAICSYLQVLILLGVLKKRLGLNVTEGLLKSILKLVPATIVMYIAGFYALKYMESMGANFWANIIRLLVLVPLSAFVYYIACRILRVEMLGFLFKPKKV